MKLPECLVVTCSTRYLSGSSKGFHLNDALDVETIDNGLTRDPTNVVPWLNLRVTVICIKLPGAPDYRLSTYSLDLALSDRLRRTPPPPSASYYRRLPSRTYVS